MPLLIEHLETAGVLRRGLTLREAAETVWAVNSTEVYQLMTETRGWTAPQYERWLADTLARLLLADDVRLAASGPAPGLLAFDGGIAVGWCELAPRADLGWLARARNLQPVDDLPVWSVPCFYVRRTHRGQGVMGALIEAAVATAAAAGAPALEAYPVDTATPAHIGNLFPGTVAAFARHGFQVVARRQPDRPVMRRKLGSGSEPVGDPGQLGGG